MDRIAVQESGILNDPRSRHHHVAYTEINLNSQAHVVHACVHQNSGAFVFGILFYFLGDDTVCQEREAVWLYIHGCTVLHERHQACLIGLSLAKHVDVHGGTRARNADGLQQERAFQNDSLCML